MVIKQSRGDYKLPVRFNEYVTTDFAQRLLNPIFRFVGGRLIEVRCRFVGFDRNADEKKQQVADPAPARRAQSRDGDEPQRGEPLDARMMTPEQVNDDRDRDRKQSEQGDRVAHHFAHCRAALSD